MVNSNSLRIKMFKKRRAILPVLVIPALLVGLKVIDVMLERRKKK